MKEKAQKWANFCGRFLPGIRAIFLSGSLAKGTNNKNSDIDFLIITTSKKMWTARFFLILMFTITGQLARPKNHRKKICPNHFLSEDLLEIREKNKYTANMFSQNIPLFDPQNIFELFREKNKNWIFGFGYTFKKTEEKPMKILNKKQTENWVEKITKWLQVQKIKNNKTYQSQKKILATDAGVFWDKWEIKLHPEKKSEK